ncbi:MAG: methyltransferase domain-containing protein [Alphaproteobacteria bacterium]|nr:methyltransferase domain-containing protein [Alphaproteobacteria bacterium]
MARKACTGESVREQPPDSLSPRATGNSSRQPPRQTSRPSQAVAPAARTTTLRVTSLRENGSRTLGPVSDLERHLPSEWWRTLFNSLYLETDGDIVENDRNTQQDVDLLIRSTGITPDDRILDLCCGQGRHALELSRRGFRHVIGLDRSRYLVRLARKRAKQANLPVSFHEGDARRFRLGDGEFRCVCILGNSFGYFDRLEDDAAVLAAVRRSLASGGTVVMDLMDGEWMRSHFEARSWEWVDQNHFVCRERALAGDGDRLISREVVVHAERGVIADQFYAERLYSRERLGAQLRDAGFGNVRFHSVATPDSSRNQDLGMVEHRLFLTGEAPQRPQILPRRAVQFPEVTVLLGDPRLPDPVKRDGRFNEEDAETVARLKSALADVPGYRFRYLDNHTTLFADLKARRPDFVLNFCDEGFNNDALLEMHVPSLLEMLDIPYSGAGPACLGLCYNKSLVRGIAEAIDVPVPAETYCNSDDLAATIPSGVFPALIKPNFGDSSIGITKDAVVHNWEQASAFLGQLREQLPGCPILIQEFLTGPEYSVGVIGNPGSNCLVLPVLEVDYSRLDADLPRLLTYESKWIPDSPYWTQIGYREAQLDEDVRRRIVDYSNILFERLGCRDYARFDFRADAHGEIKLLEVNPNPGWCWDGKLNLMAEMVGLGYADLLRLIIEAAQDRTATRRAGTVVPMTPPLVARAG